MTDRFKCLTCRSIVNDKSVHSRRTRHDQFIRIGLEEDSTSLLKLRSIEYVEDEIAGRKRMIISLDTYEMIKEISVTMEGATFEDIIRDAINALKRESENNGGKDQLERIVTNDSEEE